MLGANIREMNYTTSGGSGSRKRTHTNTKASKNYAAKPPDEEPLYQYMGSTGIHPSPLPGGQWPFSSEFPSDLAEKRIFSIIKQGKKTREVTSPGPWPLRKGWSQF